MHSVPYSFLLILVQIDVCVFTLLSNLSHRGSFHFPFLSLSFVTSQSLSTSAFQRYLSTDRAWSAWGSRASADGDVDAALKGKGKGMGKAWPGAKAKEQRSIRRLLENIVTTVVLVSRCSTRKALLLVSVQRNLPNAKVEGIDVETCLPDSTVQHAPADESWIFSVKLIPEL